MRLYAAVGTIAYPARHAKINGLPLRPATEEYALNAAENAYAAAYPSHHITLMSGASSAFMPTTL